MERQELINKLQEELKYKDWWYIMADDHSSYSAGDRHHRQIMAMVKELGQEGVEIYNNAVKQAFKNDEDCVRRLSI